MASVDITGIAAALESLIAERVAAYEAELREALGRKLTDGNKRRKKGGPAKSKSPQRSSGSGPRRSSEEVDALCERLLGAVEATPGETMTVLSASLKLRPAELSLPASRLKKTGRVRTVGDRSRTRYYPMTPRAA